MWKWIAAFALVAGVVFADPTLKYTVDFADNTRADQFHIYTSVQNTPVIEFSLFQGRTPYTPPAGTGGYLAYGRTDSDRAMTFVQNAVITGSVMRFETEPNDFPIHFNDYYCAVVLTNSQGGVVSFARGKITVRRSPEVSATAILARTYAINGAEYGPFTGPFLNWPFLSKDELDWGRGFLFDTNTYTVSVDISSLAVPVTSVFGRTGDVVAAASDYEDFYDPIGSASAVSSSLSPFSIES
jgi:hypothetical protein